MARSSFLVCSRLTPNPAFPEVDWRSANAEDEDRGMSQNGQGGMREDRQGRIEGAHDRETRSGLERPLRAAFGAGFVTRNQPVRVEEKPASPSSRGRASRTIVSPVAFSLSSAFTKSSSWQNGLSPQSVPGETMAQCRDRDRSLR